MLWRKTKWKIKSTALTVELLLKIMTTLLSMDKSYVLTVFHAIAVLATDVALLSGIQMLMVMNTQISASIAMIITIPVASPVKP